MSHCTLQPLRTNLKRLEPVIPHPQSKDKIPRLAKETVNFYVLVLVM
jgi:hypothetical protein